MAERTLLLGAVAYDPRVVTIWEGIRTYFGEQGVPMDFALFSNYERQVEELLAGHIGIAWNTPLGHVRVQKRTGGRSLSLQRLRQLEPFRGQRLEDAAGRALGLGQLVETLPG